VDAFLEAIAPLVAAVGGTVVRPGEIEPSDVELCWRGKVVAGVRLGVEGRDLSWHVESVQKEMGVPLASLDRLGKQRVVKMLNERGAFELRRSVERVAEELGISRFTVYNYLNRPDS